ncbi:MAG: hypothetical protein ABSF29_14210 [Tepidisphaeraceae bacterium]
MVPTATVVAVSAQYPPSDSARSSVTISPSLSVDGPRLIQFGFRQFVQGLGGDSRLRGLAHQGEDVIPQLSRAAHALDFEAAFNDDRHRKIYASISIAVP